MCFVAMVRAKQFSSGYICLSTLKKGHGKQVACLWVCAGGVCFFSSLKFSLCCMCFGAGAKGGGAFIFDLLLSFISCIFFLSWFFLYCQMVV